jgi:hypothetical protein
VLIATPDGAATGFTARHSRNPADPTPIPSHPPPTNPTTNTDRQTSQLLATRFAGSMAFVYFHIIWFAVWIIFGIEGYPFGLLTMIVSLEAIFVSTFVMISRNSADFKRQAPRISSGTSS